MSKAHVLWLTGLSRAGKSTIAQGLEAVLKDKGKSVFMLDGDKVREALKKPLGFSPEDIAQNNAGIAEVCFENLSQYDYILVSVIAPFRAVRERNRKVLGDAYHEIYVKASLDQVSARDVKG